MLLTQLVAYAERLEKEEGKTKIPFMYQEQSVRWLVYLDAQGNFEEMQMTSDGSGKKNDRGKRFVTPHIMRSSGAKAKLLADNAEYALGIGKEGADPSKVAERHRLFKEEVVACAEATKLSELEALRHYLFDVLPKQPIPLPEGFLADDVVSFVVDGIRPFELEPVQSYWAGKFVNTPSDAEESGFQTECLISGTFGPVMEREPVKIKGIPGGQTSGMNFISANAAAFESYGLSASQIAPVRLDLAEKYANALNTLLKDPYTSLRLGPAVYAFWTRSGKTPPVVEDLREPGKSDRLARLRKGQILEPLPKRADSQQVRTQFTSVYSGNLYADLEPDEFYCASLSASGSRVVVRDHFTTTVEVIGESLATYFASQTLIDAEPLGLYELAACLYRDANKEMVANVPTAILDFALHQTPLPFNFLAKLTARNRAEQRVTRPRAVLTKMVLLSHPEWSFEMDELQKLEADRPEVGYHLGRLLAVLEGIQRSALGDTNTTVVDRFYGSLSTTPAIVFSRLLSGARDHLGKIRKSNPGAYTKEEKRLQEVMAHIANVPSVLPLEQQALFSLGFYHQKARRFEEIQEAKAAKAARGE
jgi:CRISPR-associated protein Csd1